MAVLDLNSRKTVEVSSYVVRFLIERWRQFIIRNQTSNGWTIATPRGTS